MASPAVFAPLGAGNQSNQSNQGGSGSDGSDANVPLLDDNGAGYDDQQYSVDGGIDGGVGAGDGYSDAWSEEGADDQAGVGTGGGQNAAGDQGYQQGAASGAQGGQQAQGGQDPVYAPAVSGLEGDLFSNEERLQLEQMTVTDPVGAYTQIARRVAQQEARAIAAFQAQSGSLAREAPALIERYGPAMQHHAMSLNPAARNTPMGRNYALMAAIAEEALSTGDPFGVMERALAMRGNGNGRQAQGNQPQQRQYQGQQPPRDPRTGQFQQGQPQGQQPQQRGVPSPQQGGRPAQRPQNVRGDKAGSVAVESLGLNQYDADALLRHLR